MFRPFNRCRVGTAHRHTTSCGGHCPPYTNLAVLWHRRGQARAGLTLLELLIAISIMVMTVGALGALAKAVQLSAEYGEGHGEATQHARVILERISRMVREANANDLFPGFIVVSERSGIRRFPDTLVIWHSDDEPVDADGASRLPRYEELIIYTPHATDSRNPENQQGLLEITLPGDTATAPSIDNETAWVTKIAAAKTSGTAKRVTLTELLRTCLVDESSAPRRLAAVRFESRLRPSDDDWNQYRSGNLGWENIPWAQGIHGMETGLRQAWLRMELQLMPGERAAENDPGGQQAIPFFGSACLYYELQQ